MTTRWVRSSVRPQDTADTLNGPGQVRLGSRRPPTQNDRCGFGPRLPLLVISPWARQNFVDNTFTDQASILQFIEDNWNLGRIGGESADAAAGTLDNAFDFNQSYGHAPAIILERHHRRGHQGDPGDGLGEHPVGWRPPRSDSSALRAARRAARRATAPAAAGRRRCPRASRRSSCPTSP